MKSKLFKFLTLMAVMMMTASLALPASAGPNFAAGVTKAEPGDYGLKTDAEAPAAVQSELKTSETGLYIVQLADAPLASYMGGIAGYEATSPAVTGADKLDVNAPAAVAYRGYLEAQQSAFIAAMEQTLGRTVNVEFRYLNALNGMAVYVSAQEAAALLGLPGVKAVTADTFRYVDTDVSPEWIGATSIWAGDTGPGVGTKGEGVIVGVIDSGVNHLHPSFADVGGDGYDHTNPWGPGVYVGYCATDPTFCNDKLIGAYDFYPGGSGGPEDADGHGSHTMSTSAGNTHVMSVTVDITATISGIAPHANVIAYKVCSPSCPGSASVMSVDQAIIDGADVLNYSISGSDDPWNDPVDLAFLDAFNAGIFVSASAGNAGPNPSTVAKTGPWNAAVAMATLPRLYANSLDVTVPVTSTLQDLAALEGDGPALVADLTREVSYDPANLTGCTAFSAGYFTDKIALVQRGGCTFATKVTNASAAGAVAMVVFNNRGGPPIAMSVGGTIPSFMLGLVDGLALQAEIDANAPVTARLNAEVTRVANPDFADIIDSGSSRGPSQHEVLKPDYAAPGVNVLAAVAALPGDPAQYAFYTGTSMAAPHGAGSATLLIALHPDWSPAEVKSALASTTRPWQEIRATTATSVIPANPFDTGSGRINLSWAGKVGFVMDETYDNYVAANPDTGGDPKLLNQPSLVDYSCVGTCTWVRTLTSVLPFAATYTPTFITAVPTLTFSVEPAVFTLPAGGTQVVTITADVVGLPIDAFVFGDVIFETDATFPIVVAPEAVLLSENFDGVTEPALPAQWDFEVVALPAEGPLWETNAGTVHPSGVTAYSAPNVVYFNSWSAGTGATARLFYTDTLDLSGFDSAAVSFWMYHDTGYSSAPDSVQVEVSTDGGTSWNPVGSAFNRYNGTTGWAEKTVDLGAYVGQASVMVGFLGYSAYGNDVHLDDISVNGFLAGDPVVSQHLTAAVRPALAAAPDAVGIVTDMKSGSIDVSGFQVITDVLDLQVSVDGLSKGASLAEDLIVDPTNGDPYNGDGGTMVIFYTVPEGAMTFLAEVVFSEAPDVDLFVGTGSTPSAATVVCTSASGIWQESCQIDDPDAGDYWVLAQNWAGSDTPPDRIVLTAGAVMPGDQGNLSVTDPGVIPAGEPFSLEFNWDEPELVDGDRWMGFVTLGSSPATPDNIGQVFVSIDYLQPIFVTKDAPATAYEGEVFTYTLTLDGVGPIDGMGWITDTLPTGVTYVTNTVTATFGSAWYDAGDNAIYWNTAAGRAALPGSEKAVGANGLVFAEVVGAAATDAAGAPSAIALESKPFAPEAVLYDNGPLVTHPAGGAGGLDASALQSALLLSTYGFGHALSSGYRVADDFTVPTGGWNISQITFFAYQTGSSTTSTINHLNLRIWDGVPGAAGSNVVWGDTSTNVLANTTFSNIYRVLDTALTGSTRPIMASTAAVNTILPAGTYWLDWQTGGTLASGPWAPPISILGQTTTGNGLQYDPTAATWNNLIDTGAAAAQGLPFIIEGEPAIVFPETITISFQVEANGDANSILNAAELEYNGDPFTAEAETTLVADVTFLYNDLEDVVLDGESVWVAGDFTDWGTSPELMDSDEDETVFTATLTIPAGAHEYKYIVESDASLYWNWLQSNNRSVVVDEAAQTVEDFRNVEPGYYVLQWPVSTTTTVGTATENIYAQIWADDLTAPAGEGRSLMVELGYGDVMTYTDWMWAPMAWYSQEGNNDQFAAVITPTEVGEFMYAMRFDANWGVGNPNAGWTYGDLDWSDPAFVLEDTGVLTVLTDIVKIFLPLVLKAP